MITVGMNYNIIEGKDAQFIAVFEKVMGVMNDMPGHAKTNLYRDVHAEHDYVVISEWTDKSAFDAFIASDRFKNVTDWGRDNVLRERPKHQVYGADTTPPATCPAHAS